METGEEKSGKWKIIFILIFLVIIVIIALAIALFERKEETKEETNERLRLLNHRHGKLKTILEKKKNIHRWKFAIFRMSFMIARVIILGVFCFGWYSASYYFDDPSLKDHMAWIAFLAMMFSAVVFLFVGIPTNIASVLKEVRPKIETWVFRKYLGIEDAIHANEQEIAVVAGEIDDLKNNLPPSISE
jgi:Na+/melibiose symporter-like transporter